MLNFLRVALAASAFYGVASAADLDVVEGAVAAGMVIFTGADVASYAVIYIFHNKILLKYILYEFILIIH